MKSLLRYLVLVSLIFNTSLLSAQIVIDSIYKNVIDINHKNTVYLEEYYLTDIPIKASKRPVVFYNSLPIPNKLFFNDSFYPEIKEFILVSPNPDYIDSTGRGMIGDTKLLTSSTLYRVRRGQGGVQIDSVVHVGSDGPKLYLQESVNLPDGYIKVYYADCYGPNCPIAPYFELKPSAIAEYVVGYQKDHNTKLNGIYLGKGKKSTIMFLTLSDLSAREKVGFILGARHSKRPDRHLAKFAPDPPQIFTPSIVRIKRLKKVDVE